MSTIPEQLLKSTTDPVAQTLNQACFCIGLDQASLRAELQSGATGAEIAGLLEERLPYVFSSNPVFLAASHVTRMAQIVETVEAVLALPAIRTELLQKLAQDLAPSATNLKGVFLGYDFHVNDDQIGLIEINTNAGGAMLNVLLARAQKACCQEVEQMMPDRDLAAEFETNILAMFQREWRLAGRVGELRTIAIVDAAPAGQYLYPEFLLFQQLFESHGIRALVLDPDELDLRDGVLVGRDVEIDLVYNRLTDFAFDDPQNRLIKRAWAEGIAVVTPNPHTHALYADKRNLALLTSRDRLLQAGATPEQIEILLNGIPSTELVTPEKAAQLWSKRRNLFFKPAAGYGSKAAYRGDKITTRVWQEVLAGQYIAQELVHPGERQIGLAADQRFKYDIRNYVYDGAVLWLAARLYQGQTTNFRTHGGGFAPVYAPEVRGACRCGPPADTVTQG